MNNTPATTYKIMNYEYPLKLSVNAMQEINKLYGGVETAAQGLTGDGNVFEKLRIAISLFSILATEGARSYNFEHPNEPPIPDLPVSIAGTVMTVADLGRVTPLIVQAMNEGLDRKVFSEDEGKNTEGA